MKKTYLLILPFAFIFLVVLFFLFSKKTINQQPDSFITPTPVKVNSGDAVGGVKEDTGPAAIEEDRKSNLVTQLIHQTPHKDANFSLYYDFKKDIFILYINPSDKQLGKIEFQGFLKQNGIDDISWINNLFITYIPVDSAETPISPAP